MLGGAAALRDNVRALASSKSAASVSERLASASELLASTGEASASLASDPPSVTTLFFKSANHPARTVASLERF